MHPLIGDPSLEAVAGGPVFLEYLVIDIVIDLGGRQGGYVCGEPIAMPRKHFHWCWNQIQVRKRLSDRDNSGEPFRLVESLPGSWFSCRD